MFTETTRHRIVAGATVLTAVASVFVTKQAYAAPTASDSSSLTVLAAGPAVAPSSSAADVTVAVQNSYDQLLCSPFTVTLTWWRAHGRRHSVTRAVSNQLGTAVATLRIPAGAMRAGQVHYYASAGQDCGLLAPTTRYEGRWPASGSASVAVV